MFWRRVLIFGIPLAALGLAGWAAWQAREGRQAHRPALVVLLPGPVPALHPFQPATEIEAQILDLLHEPLVRISADGHYAPGLAERWTWQQEVTCWFATQETAETAALRLEALKDQKWPGWNLARCQSHKNALQLRFHAQDGAEEVLKTISDLRPLPVFFVRLDAGDAAPAWMLEAAKDESSGIRRAWVSSDHACEIVTTLEPATLLKTVESLAKKHHAAAPALQPMGQAAALLEPVLLFHLRSDARWPDGAFVSTPDVAATVKRALAEGWSLPDAESFRQIESISPGEGDTVRVVYRKRHNDALFAWTTLPVQQAAWLERHPGKLETPPPGAGRYTLAAKSPRSLRLEARDAASSLLPSMEFVTRTTPLVKQAALATGALDVIWEAPGPEAAVDALPRWLRRATPPRTRLQVLWNLRAPVLADVRVRQALALGTDRAALIQELLHGHGQVVEGIYQPGLWFATPRDPQPFDPGAARQLLDAAGWLRDVDGIARRPGKVLEIELLVAAESSARRKLVDMLAAQWRALGVVTRIRALPQKEIVGDRLPARQFDAAIVGQSFETCWDSPQRWHSRQTTPGGMNDGGVNDPLIDLLLQALEAETDPSKIAERARLFEEALLKLHPTLPLFAGVDHVMIRDDMLPPALVQDAGTPFTLRRLALPTRIPALQRPQLKMREPEE